ncbi:MAG: CapA family protein, partial [Firmicutes bacterium]|nr:CapA family protein [Bacillota bacterium]
MKVKKQNTELFKKLILILSATLVFTSCAPKTEETVAEVTEEIVEEIIYANSGEMEVLDYPVSTAKIAVTGDIMVHSYQYEEAYDAETNTYNFMHNFTDVKKYFDTADYAIGNFETVLGGEDIGISDYPCFNTPDSFLDSLQFSGIDMVTTANNHCVDRGTASLIRTIEKLDEYGFDHVGTYASEEERDTIFIKDINGIKFAFLSYTYGTNGLPYQNDWNVNIINEDLIRNDIAAAKELNPDFIVVIPHMGNEYELYPKDIFKNWAQFMFDCGADIILASHPHVLQPMKIVELEKEDGSTRNGFIIYSLGNFISSQTTPPRNAGMILNLEFEKEGKKQAEITRVSFIPVWTQFRNAENVNHFKVRSVYEMLTLPEDEIYDVIRVKDHQRIKDIHYETTSIYFDKEIPMEEIQDEYV